MAGERDPQDAAHNMGNHLPLLPGNLPGPVPGGGGTGRGSSAERQGWGAGRGAPRPAGAPRGAAASQASGHDRVPAHPSRAGSPQARGEGLGVAEGSAPKPRDPSLSARCVSGTWLLEIGLELRGREGGQTEDAARLAAVTFPGRSSVRVGGQRAGTKRSPRQGPGSERLARVSPFHPPHTTFRIPIW